MHKSFYSVNPEDKPLETFDVTGMFHCGAEQEFENCLLETRKRHAFTDHIVVCVFAKHNSPLIDLRNFVLPLRFSNYHYSELKPIVFLGNKEFLEQEWPSICYFPKIFILPVSRTIFFITIK